MQGWMTHEALHFPLLCAQNRGLCLQVVDFFGFGLPDIRKEMMSMHHTHDAWGSLVPKVTYISAAVAVVS